MSENSEKWFWKGKQVTKKVYEQRCKQVKLGKSIRKLQSEKMQAAITATTTTTTTRNYNIRGRRIIHPDTLAQQLFCIKCGSILSLADCVQETKISLASIFHVKCRSCEVINTVNSDKTHEVPGKKRHYDVNTKAAIGCLDAGMGYTRINKLLSGLNIPQYNWQSYKIHEEEIGLAAEKLARESYIRAVSATFDT